MSVIKQLWYGNLHSSDKKSISTDRTRELVLKLDELEQKLVKKMSEEDKREFEKYIEITDEMYSELLANSFAKGFKLGARLIKEALEP